MIRMNQTTLQAMTGADKISYFICTDSGATNMKATMDAYTIAELDEIDICWDNETREANNK